MWVWPLNWYERMRKAEARVATLEDQLVSVVLVNKQLETAVIESSLQLTSMTQLYAQQLSQLQRMNLEHWEVRAHADRRRAMQLMQELEGSRPTNLRE